MQPITNSLISATRKAVKFLQRDFLELEMLQRSSRGNDDFCNKSYSRIKALLEEELQKHSKFLFFPDNKFELDDVPDIVLLVNPLDSLSNLAKSLPFFALSITYLKRINETLTPIYSVLNFPVLDKIYYAEKGRGVWVEENSSHSLSKNRRLRVSGCVNMEKALIATNVVDSDMRFLRNIRVFGSYCYEIILLAAGKLDAVYFTSLNYTLRHSFQLMVRESGGVMIDNDKKFIATNYDLAAQFKRQFVINNVIY